MGETECDVLGHDPQEWLLRRGGGLDQDGRVVHGPAIGREVRCARCGWVLEAFTEVPADG